MRLVIGILLLLHGLVYSIMFALPLSSKVKADMAPFDPSRSWMLGERSTLGFVFALLVTILFAIVASGYLAHSGWWPWLMIVACVASLVLLGLFASWYFIVGYVISIGLAVWAILELSSSNG
jgi:hypothetical protein